MRDLKTNCVNTIGNQWEGFTVPVHTGKNKKVIEISPLLAFWPERAKE